MTKHDKSYNYYVNHGDYLEVAVNNSDIVYKIDKDDEEFCRTSNWYSSPDDGYEYMATKKKVGEEWIRVRFHIEIMKDEILDFIADKKYNKRIIVDHINGDISDNRKVNLRVRTQSENNMNKRLQKNSTTMIVGVSWNNKGQMWSSYISFKGKRINIGNFYYLRNAVKARIDAEQQYFGEHAYMNRDKAYREKIEEILSLPRLDEPPILQRKKNTSTGFTGVVKIKKRYRARIEKIVGNENKVEQKLFDSLEEAVEWRKQKEFEYYGQFVMYTDEKLPKQI